MSALLETAVIGFGVVGAIVVGNAAAQTAKATGCTENQQLAAGCVGAGLAVAVLPATAIAGVFITGKAAYELATNPAAKAKLAQHVETAKAKTRELAGKARGTTPAATKRVAAKR
jgi:hypothetical protein